MNKRLTSKAKRRNAHPDIDQAAITRTRQTISPSREHEPSQRPSAGKSQKLITTHTVEANVFRLVDTAGRERGLFHTSGSRTIFKLFSLTEDGPDVACVTDIENGSGIAEIFIGNRSIAKQRKPPKAVDEFVEAVVLIMNSPLTPEIIYNHLHDGLDALADGGESNTSVDAELLRSWLPRVITKKQKGGNKK